MVNDTTTRLSSLNDAIPRSAVRVGSAEVGMVGPTPRLAVLAPAGSPLFGGTLRVAAVLDPDLFRGIYNLARERYETGRASFHVSAELEHAPADPGDAELPTLLEQFDAREILHVTFGSVLDEPPYRERLFALLRGHPEDYTSGLETHFLRHLKPFAPGGPHEQTLDARSRPALRSEPRAAQGGPRSIREGGIPSPGRPPRSRTTGTAGRPRRHPGDPGRALHNPRPLRLQDALQSGHPHGRPRGSHDRRYLDAVMETAGLYNTAGFNDDTRAFASIQARHDVWRRVTCDWLAGMVVTGVMDVEEAGEMAQEFAHGLARRAYGLEREAVREA